MSSYRPETTILKGAGTTASTTAIAVAICAIANLLGVDIAKEEGAAIAVTIGIVNGLWKAYRNWRKNRKK